MIITTNKGLNIRGRTTLGGYRERQLDVSEHSTRAVIIKCSQG